MSVKLISYAGKCTKHEAERPNTGTHQGDPSPLQQVPPRLFWESPREQFCCEPSTGTLLWNSPGSEGLRESIFLCFKCSSGDFNGQSGLRLTGLMQERLAHNYSTTGCMFYGHERTSVTREAPGVCTVQCCGHWSHTATEYSKCGY